MQIFEPHTLTSTQIDDLLALMLDQDSELTVKADMLDGVSSDAIALKMLV